MHLHCIVVALVNLTSMHTSHMHSACSTFTGRPSTKSSLCNSTLIRADYILHSELKQPKWTFDTKWCIRLQNKPHLWCGVRAWKVLDSGFFQILDFRIWDAQPVCGLTVHFLKLWQDTCIWLSNRSELHISTVMWPICNQEQKVYVWLKEYSEPTDNMVNLRLVLTSHVQIQKLRKQYHLTHYNTAMGWWRILSLVMSVKPPEIHLATSTASLSTSESVCAWGNKVNVWKLLPLSIYTVCI